MFIDFARRPPHDAPGPVYLVVDGQPAHRATATKTFAAAGRLKLVSLPGYAPELDPDGWVRKDVRHDRIARAGVTSAVDPKAKASAALRRLQKTPHIIRGSFADPHLAHINA